MASASADTVSAAAAVSEATVRLENKFLMVFMMFSRLIKCKFNQNFRIYETLCVI